MEREKRLVIIDCDTGIDDALALLLAFRQPDWDILGITAVAGNVPLEHTVPNTIRVCTLAGERVPVYAGAEKPLYRQLHDASRVHGSNGIGGVELPLGYASEGTGAVDFLINAMHRYPGRITLIALGPLTNVAQAILRDEAFPSRVKEVLCMGGAVHGGNVTAVAEFNIYADPEAARIVFRAGMPITMVGLDVTMQALLGHDVVDRWRKDGSPVLRAAGEMLYSYRHFYDGAALPGVALHDPLTVAAAADPDLLVTEHYYVDIETRSTLSAGRTVVDELRVTGRQPNTAVAVGHKREQFLDGFIRTIESYRG